MRSSKTTLRYKLDEAFNALFPEADDLSQYLSDFSAKKTVENSPRNPEKTSCVPDDDGGLGVDEPGKDDTDDTGNSSGNDDEQPSGNNATIIDTARSDPPLVPQAASYVKGQSLFGAVDPAEMDSMLFSNGAEVHLEHYLHSFVEHPAEKARASKIFAAMRYAPSDSLIVASVNLFSRKQKRHFFRDGLYFTKVFAKEMGMTLSVFLRVRGWLVVNKKGTISISYRRISDCLRLLGVDAAMNYYRVSAMFDRLFRVLQSREVFPLMPYEKGMFPIVEMSPMHSCSLLTVFQFIRLQE
jgi:hypothetical protein